MGLEIIILSEISFPDSSVGKESACNVGDLSLIPRSGRSTEEGIDYPPEYSWASPVAQLVKNLHAVWETWARSLGWDDPLEKGKATHSSVLAWRVPWIVCTVNGVTKSQTLLSDFRFSSQTEEDKYHRISFVHGI